MKTKTKAKKLEHHLITVGGRELLMHCYLVTAEGKSGPAKLGCINKMMDEMEKRGAHIVPMALVSKLSDGVEAVQAAAVKAMPSSKRLLETMKDFHCSIWALPKGDPDAEALMKMH